MWSDLAKRAGGAVWTVLPGRLMTALTIGGLLLSTYLFFTGSGALAAVALVIVIVFVVIILVGAPPVVFHSLPDPRHYSGYLSLPRRVYVSDSHAVTLELTQTLLTRYLGVPLANDEAHSGSSISVPISSGTAEGAQLSATLLAAAIVVDGNKRQCQPLSSPILRYRWGCYFPNSGNHAVDVLLQIESASGTVDVSTMHREVKVVQVDHLTQRQVWLLAWVAGMVSGGLAVAQVLRGLRVW